MKTLVFEKMTQELAAGQSWPVQIAGNTFRLAVAAYPVSVSLLKNFRVIGTMQNMRAGDFAKDIDFDGVVILNGSAAQSVSIQLSGGGAGSDRVVGEVSVINGEVARVKAGAAFIAAPYQTGVAGQISHVGLHNPLGSGKNIVLSKMLGYSSVAGGLLVNSYSSQLTTLYGYGINKKIGGAVSVGELRVQSSAVALGLTVGAVSLASAGDSREFNFSEPLVLVPGKGVLMYVNQANATLSTTFQWIEESIDAI